jgi:hypothetical protein
MVTFFLNSIFQINNLHGDCQSGWRAHEILPSQFFIEKAEPGSMRIHAAMLAPTCMFSSTAAVGSAAHFFLT